jgi:hypothetical protein
MPHDYGLHAFNYNYNVEGWFQGDRRAGAGSAGPLGNATAAAAGRSDRAGRRLKRLAPGGCTQALR